MSPAGGAPKRWPPALRQPSDVRGNILQGRVIGKREARAVALEGYVLCFRCEGTDPDCKACDGIGCWPRHAAPIRCPPCGGTGILRRCVPPTNNPALEPRVQIDAGLICKSCDGLGAVLPFHATERGLERISQDDAGQEGRLRDGFKTFWVRPPTWEQRRETLDAIEPKFLQPGRRQLLVAAEGDMKQPRAYATVRPRTATSTPPSSQSLLPADVRQHPNGPGDKRYDGRWQVTPARPSTAGLVTATSSHLYAPRYPRPPHPRCQPDPSPKLPMSPVYAPPLNNTTDGTSIISMCKTDPYSTSSSQTAMESFRLQPPRDRGPPSPPASPAAVTVTAKLSPRPPPSSVRAKRRPSPSDSPNKPSSPATHTTSECKPASGQLVLRLRRPVNFRRASFRSPPRLNPVVLPGHVPG